MMKTTHVLFALVAVTAAYALLLKDPVPVAQAETSGTRLKAKVINGSDGSQLFDPEVLRDTTLDIDCKFHKATDGVQRCLPLVGPDVIDAWASVAYSDDQCESAVFITDPFTPSCDPPKYAHLIQTGPVCAKSAEDHAFAIYEFGAYLPSNTTVYNKNGSGQCVLGAIPYGKDAYALGTPLPPSSFVAGTAGIDP